MAQQKNTRLEKHQIDAIKDMVERGVADNESEAHRMFLSAGMREYGYENGEYGDTALKGFVAQAAWLLTVTGLVGLVFTFAYPISARMPSFAVLVAGVGLIPVREWLESREPDVSNRLKELFGRETA
ncbi:MAG: hypothetical protein ABEI52_07905 [Halobacteriaceae archaeon]